MILVVLVFGSDAFFFGLLKGSNKCECRKYVVKQCVPDHKEVCHITNIKSCESKLEDVCTYEKREVCSTVYESKTTYENKKECKTVYKTVTESKKENLKEFENR